MSQTVHDDFIFPNFRLSWFETLQKNSYKMQSFVRTHPQTCACVPCYFPIQIVVTFGLPDSMRKQTSSHVAVMCARVCVFIYI